MIEPEQMLKVRQSDLALIKELVPKAISIYRSIMKKEVMALEEVSEEDIKCRVLIDEKSFLPEWNEKD